MLLSKRRVANGCTETSLGACVTKSPPVGMGVSPPHLLRALGWGSDVDTGGLAAQPLVQRVDWGSSSWFVLTAPSSLNSGPQGELLPTEGPSLLQQVAHLLVLSDVHISLPKENISNHWGSLSGWKLNGRVIGGPPAASGPSL